MYYVALRMLMGDTAKYIGIIVGVTFAALIMTQQPSIFVGLMTRTFSFITDIGYPDLWVADPKVRFIDDIRPLQDTKLYLVRGVPGVAWAMPLYKGNLRARTPDGNFQGAEVIGVDDATLIGAPSQMVEGSILDLRKQDAIIVDEDGARKRLQQTNPDGTKRPLRVGDTLEINDYRAVVVGIARVTRGFQSRPAIYTTYSNAMKFAPSQRLLLSFILAGVKEGEDVKEVQKRIHERTGLDAHTRQEFKDMTLNYFLKNTGIPINFGISVMLGFLVGAAIAGQMFYNFTLDNLKQFGALKAMGASNWLLVKMITLQALLVGFIGWGIGVGAGALFGYQMRNSVLAFRMVPEILMLSASGVVVIIILASLISIVKVLRLEPAIVFKG